MKGALSHLQGILSQVVTQNSNHFAAMFGNGSNSFHSATWNKSVAAAGRRHLKSLEGIEILCNNVVVVKREFRGESTTINNAISRTSAGGKWKVYFMTFLSLPLTRMIKHFYDIKAEWIYQLSRFRHFHFHRSELISSSWINFYFIDFYSFSFALVPPNRSWSQRST